MLHGERHHLQRGFPLSLRIADNVAVALHYHEYVVNPDTDKQEGNDGVHGAEDKVEARTDAIAGEEAKITAAQTHRGESRLE